MRESPDGFSDQRLMVNNILCLSERGNTSYYMAVGLLEHYPSFRAPAVRSAGTRTVEALIPVTQRLVDWADLIVLATPETERFLNALPLDLLPPTVMLNLPERSNVLDVRSVKSVTTQKVDKILRKGVDGL